MAVLWLRYAVVLMGLVALLARVEPLAAQAPGADDLTALHDRVSQLHSQGKYAEALPLAQRYFISARQKHGEEHAEFATANILLANVYRAQGRYAEAEPLYKRAVSIFEKALGPEQPLVGISLNNLAEIYRAQGRYSEAEPLYKRAVSIFEKAFGHDQPLVGLALNNLAELYRGQGRYAEAEPLYKRALTLREKALGPDHADVGQTLNNLAALYANQGRYAEAEPLYKRTISNLEKALGPDHPLVGTALNNLAELYRTQGRYDEAESFYTRTVAILEGALGPDHPLVGTAINNLAVLNNDRGRYAEAEPLYKRSLAIRELALGPNHREVGESVNNLAEFYRAQGRDADAEPLYQRALVITEKALGPDHPDVGMRLNNLAVLYGSQGRQAEAEPLYKRALAIRETALGADHADVGHSLSSLAEFYRGQGRYADAEPLCRRALAVTEKALGANHPDVGLRLNNLAALFEDQGRYAEAEPLYKRSLAIRETALGRQHPDVGQSLNNLAFFYRMQGRYAEAEPLYQQALAIREAALGADHPSVGASLNNLAALHIAQRDWLRAADFWRRSTGVVVRRMQRGTDDVGRALVGQKSSEAVRESDQFAGLIKASYRLESEGRGTDHAREMFPTAQWAQGSEAAQSVAQMAARSAKGDSALAVLVRERQDLVAEWQKRDAIRGAAVALVPDKRDRAAEAANLARLAEIDTRIAAIDLRLKADFPDYAALSRPEPLSVAEVQAELRQDEALVLFLDTPAWQPTPEETFIWVVTKTDARWVKSDLGRTALAREVAALRCGLDDAPWNDADGYDRCVELVKKHRYDLNVAGHTLKVLPFDLERAHALYKALFGLIEETIRDKHLLVVPSGPLTRLPLHVLVTEPPKAAIPAALAEHRHVAWLGARQPITVLPAVSSLKALRRVARPSAATKPMIGFANPLLDGPQDDRQWGQHYQREASIARERVSCPVAQRQHVASVRGARRGLAPIIARGGLVEPAQLRRQTPLPETADELCAVARVLGADASEMRLGSRASEREVKTLSASGALAHYRVVHFATHGAVAGQLAGMAEPGLILTPPAVASAEDDGYLSASEIADLRLDADWVILSACVTAGPATGGQDRRGEAAAEALSGLARVFFYAQARALLVSHWEVYSDATVKLITHTLTAMSADKSVGRAEALRRAMLTLIENGAPHEAHPAFWAPFVVVGEGSAQR